MGKQAKNKIVKDAIRQFPKLGNKTVARYILNMHGELFDQDIEKIRDSVRYFRGRSGKSKIDRLADTSLLLQEDEKLEMPKSWVRKKYPYNLPIGLGLVLSDLHVPFHEIKPLEAAIQEGQAEKVNWIFLNGDFQDCAAVSYWPNAKREFNKEVAICIDMLDFIRQEFPEIPIIYKPGNHEYRLPRRYVDRVPELAAAPVVAMEVGLGLEERGIEFLDYFQLVMAGKLPILHGHEMLGLSRQVNPARGLFLKAKTFCACAHCHSTSEHNPRNIFNELLTTWSFGCGCDLNPDYNPFGTDWNWGHALINIENDGNFEVINRRVLPSGKVV